MRPAKPPSLPPSIRTVVRPSRSGLLNLTEFEIDGHGAPENRNLDFQPRALLVHFLDETVERSERSIRNAHLLADLEGDRRLRPLDTLLHLHQDALSFGIR